MFSRSLLVAFAAFAATVLAKTQNMDPQYALLTIANEYELYLLESLVNSSAPAQLSKFTPTKTKVHAEIISGKADLTTVTTEIGQVMLDLDKAVPGFKDAALKLASNNKLNVYGINKLTPEASWDFLYAAFKRTATELKADKILTALEKLNDDFETVFKAGGTVDTSALVTKINAFTLEAKSSASLNFEEMYTTAGDLEIDKYQAKLEKIQRGETLPAETQAPSSSGSAAKETEKPQATTNSTGSSTNETASAAVTTAPAATTATATTTPAPTSGSVSTTLSVAASVVTMAVAYLVL